MKKEIIFSMPSAFRDTFNIYGYRFGQGAQSLALVGAMRGDEIRQQFICSQIVKELKRLENMNRLIPDHEILVVPSVNPFSMNIHKRFWAMDNTDINRMFPGYDRGETTQRIAAALFEAIKGYEYGIQLGSFYLPGDFVPHVRMLHTGYEDVEGAALFGLPFISVKEPLAFDTTLLNYNWQIWETKAYTLYGGRNDTLEGKETADMVRAIIRFMQRKGIVRAERSSRPNFNSIVLQEDNLVQVKSPVAGFFYRMCAPNDSIARGDILARIINPYDGEVMAEVKSPVDGIVFFCYDSTLAMQNSPLFRLIPI